jgi:hypothetical protein
MCCTLATVEKNGHTSKGSELHSAPRLSPHSDLLVFIRTWRSERGRENSLGNQPINLSMMLATSWPERLGRARKACPSR